MEGSLNFLLSTEDLEFLKMEIGPVIFHFVGFHIVPGNMIGAEEMFVK